MFYGQCNKFGERWSLGTPSTCTCQDLVTWEDVLGAIARGWAYPENLRKPMDVELAVAIAKEIQDMYTTPPAAQPAVQAEKPVCEVLNERGEVDYISYVPPAGTLLYAAPGQWVGLTRNEAMEIVNSLVGQDWTYAVDAIEAKLKEKNV